MASNSQLTSVRDVGSVEDLLNRAFGLAYFILGDRPASIYVAMAATNKLKAALINQGRRLYYTPTGRSAHPAARTKVNLSAPHLLQRLIYVESELFERLLEGQEKAVTQDDLIIRFIKHLIRSTTKHNSFYVTLGLCRLLYNYNTGETSDIYNLVLQDPERFRDDYYYRSRKKLLMQDLKDRFGSLVRTQRVLRREERFQPQENSRQYLDLVRECLIRFTPWRSACVLPKELDPNRNVLTQLLFEGGDPDKEHQVELNRIHTLVHPECFARLIAALRLDSADKRLELPAFFVSSDGARPTENRFNPTELTQGEMEAIKRYLDKNGVQRKNFSERRVSLLVDGERQADLELDRSIEFDLKEGSELIEIRSVASIEEDENTTLAVCLLAYDQEGILPQDSSIVLGRGQRLSLTVLPATQRSGEGRGATLRVNYQELGLIQATLKSRQHIRSWLNQLIDFRPEGGLRVLKPALGLLLIALCVTSLWVYFHAKRGEANPSRVAQLQEPREDVVPTLIPSSPLPQAQTAPATRRKVDRQPTMTGSSSTYRPTPGIDLTNGVERTRGTKRMPPSTLLLTVRRVYVDPLGDDAFSKLLREKLIAALRVSSRFEIVGNRDEADAVFKGSVVRNSGQESNSSVVLELVNVRGQVVWSLSSRKEGRILSNDAGDASVTISSALLHDIDVLQRKR